MEENTRLRLSGFWRDATGCVEILHPTDQYNLQGVTTINATMFEVVTAIRPRPTDPCRRAHQRTGKFTPAADKVWWENGDVWTKITLEEVQQVLEQADAGRGRAAAGGGELRPPIAQCQPTSAPQLPPVASVSPQQVPSAPGCETVPAGAGSPGADEGDADVVIAEGAAEVGGTPTDQVHGTAAAEPESKGVTPNVVAPNKRPPLQSRSFVGRSGLQSAGSKHQPTAPVTAPIPGTGPGSEAVNVPEPPPLAKPGPAEGPEEVGQSTAPPGGGVRSGMQSAGQSPAGAKAAPKATGWRPPLAGGGGKPVPVSKRRSRSMVQRSLANGGTGDKRPTFSEDPGA